MSYKFLSTILGINANYTGLVGVGTTSPIFSSYAQLTVNGTQGGIVIQGGAAGYSRLFFAKDDTSNVEGLIRYYHSDNSMQFFTGATERMRIVSGGNVLIGTTTDAGYKLRVNGNTYIDGVTGMYGKLYWTNYYDSVTPFDFIQSTYAGGSSCGIKFTAYNPTNGVDSGLGFQVMNSSGNYVQPLYISGINNNVGIGTTSPGALLDVRGTSYFRSNSYLGASIIPTSTGVDMYLYEAGNPKIYLQSAGVTIFNTGYNFLIGTTTDPGYKLYVEGTALINGSLQVGYGSGGSGTPTQSVFQDTYGSNREAIYVKNTADYASGRGTGYGFLSGTGVERGYVRWSADDASQTGYFITLATTNSSGTLIAPVTIGSSGTIYLSSLSGSGTRMVVADSSGTLSTQSIPTGTVTGSGTTNYISKWTSSSALGNSLVYDNGTNVGIGTTSPTYKLDVNGSLYWGNPSGEYMYAGGGGHKFAYSNSTGNWLYSGGSSGLTINNAADTINLIKITDTGSLGIGTTSPVSKLEVVSTGQVSRFVSSSSNMYVTFNANSFDVGYIGNGYGTVISGSSSDFGMQASNNLLIATGGGTERMRIASNGNVLIGTTIDNGLKLRVNGVTQATSFIDSTGTRITNPGTAVSTTYSSTVTGAIKIKMPDAVLNSDTMMYFTVKIYQYATGQSYELQIGGYNYSAGQWYNVFATNLTDAGHELKVRFGYDGTSNCVWIGELTDSWSYPQVWVTDFQQGFGTSNNWADGWHITFETAFDTVNLQRTAAQVITSNSISSYGITGNGATNYLPKFTGSTSVGNSIVYDDGTNVGIGTTTPLQILHLKSSSPVIQYTKTGILNWFAGNVTGNNYTIYPDSATVNTFNITSDGNVGIGTTTPTAKFAVVGSGIGTALIGDVGIGGNYTGFSLNGTLNIGNYNFLSAYNDGLFINRQSGYDINFRENNNDQVIIKSNGNVLIGTATDAGYKLDVNGLGRFGNSYKAIVGYDGTYNGYAAIGFGGNTNGYNRVFGSSTTSDGLYLASATGHGIHFRANGGTTNNMFIAPSGNVGIGTTSPAGSLQIASTSGVIFGATAGAIGTLQLTTTSQGSPISGRLLFGTDGTGWQFRIAKNTAGTIADLFTIVDSGNVGIGTTTPYTKLELQGPANNYSNSASVTFTDSSFLSDSRRWLIGNVATNFGSLNIAVSSTNFDNPTNPVMTFTKEGNVGIGTTSPSQKLQVGDGTATGNQYVRVSSSSSDIYIGQSGSGLFGLSANAAANIVQDNSSYPLAIGTIFSRPLIFGTTNAERMRIAESGNVLIGTTIDNGYKLDVNGIIRGINPNSPSTGIITAKLLAYSPNPFGLVFRAISSGVNSIQSQREGNDSEVFGLSLNPNGGDVGIGTTTPQLTTSGRGNLTINGSSQSILTLTANNNWKTYLYTNGTDSFLGAMAEMSFAVNGAGTLAMKLALSGNVLIGTSTDNGNKLQVSGNIDSVGGGSKIGFNVNDAFTLYGVSTAHYGLTYGGSTNPVVLSGYFGLSFATVGTVQFNISSGGNVTATSLAGSGTRMVVADSSGTLSTQAIPGGGSKAYGSWQTNTTQTCPASNTPTPIIYSVIDFANDVIIDNDSAFQYTLIKMQKTGVFNIQFSAQFQNIDTQDHDVTIWLRKNGESTPFDVANSAGLVSIPSSHGGTPGHTIASWNYFVQANSGDFFQLVWETDSASRITMEYYAPGTPPPGAASVILTVNQVD